MVETEGTAEVMTVEVTEEIVMAAVAMVAEMIEGVVDMAAVVVVDMVAAVVVAAAGEDIEEAEVSLVPQELYTCD